MTNESRTIEEIDASLRRNNMHRAQAVADHTFFSIVEDWPHAEQVQRDIDLYDMLNDRFLDERLHARSLEVAE
jgi:acid stress-induced BolA-like protein IbaG/YrbA